MLRDNSKQISTKLFIASLALSTLTICAILWVNFRIAAAYQQADGKTRAWFGLVEFTRFAHKYYLVIGGLLALIFSILAYRGSTSKKLALIPIIVSVATIALVFLPIWKIIVNTSA